MLFDNRIWQTCLPYQSPVGVAHKGVVTLNFDLVSSYQDKVNGSSIPAWEGIYDGLNILQLFSYEFGGLDRAFATVIATDGTIQLWELTQADRFENEIPAQVNSGNRVQWQIEWPAFPCKDATELKELQAADIWIDREYGIVEFEAWYRSDFDPCWHWWHKWQKCVSRTSCEDVQNPVCYPVTEYREGYELPMTLPHPPTGCDSLGNAPAFQGHFFQVNPVGNVPLTMRHA